MVNWEILRENKRFGHLKALTNTVGTTIALYLDIKACMEYPGVLLEVFTTGSDNDKNTSI